MKITSLSLENFRCFEKLSLIFHPQFNVLIGENGSGKTAVMEALAKAIGNAFPMNMILEIKPHLAVLRKEDKDIRYIDTSLGKEKVFADAVKITYILSNQKTHTFDYKENNWNNDLTQITKNLLLAAKAGEKVNLPLFAYYPTNRNWAINQTEKDYEKGSRLEGYKDWFNPNVNTTFVISWLKNRESADLQQKSRNQNGEKVFEMELIRSAARNCIPNCKDIYYDFQETQLIMDIDGEKLPFHLLSSGFQNMLAIIMDLVFRCARLNPHLKEKACLETEGIVLIDEIDLHLHPKWQRSIVNSLQKTFPNLQFIVTTHSPFIIQSVNDIRLIELRKNQENEYFNKLSDLSLEVISSEIMGVESAYSLDNQKEEESSLEYLEILSKAVLDTQNQAKYLRILEERENAISDPVIRASLKMERIAKNLI